MSSEPSASPAQKAHVQYMQPTNSFKSRVNLKVGTTIDEAVKKAEANVLAYKDQGLAAIDVNLTEMLQLSAKLKSGPDAAIERKLYLLSNDVYAAAATFDQPEVSEAAYSLCELLGNRIETAPLVLESIEVHISSMRLMRQMPADSQFDERLAILGGLKKVTARLTSI